MVTNLSHFNGPDQTTNLRGRTFESFRARHSALICEPGTVPFRLARTAGSGDASEGGGVGFGEGLAGQLLKAHTMKPMIDEVPRQAGYKSGDDPVKALSAVLLADPGIGSKALPPVSTADDQTGPSAA